MKGIVHTRSLGVVLALVFLISFTAFSPNKGKRKGKIFSDAMSVGHSQEVDKCKLIEGTGNVLFLNEEAENPLFKSVKTNEVTLHIWFKEEIKENHTYYLPDSTIEVCYWEEGDLLMFRTFEPMGSLKIDEYAKGKKCKTTFDLKLINPFHNMSNSDYHYIGGEIIFFPSELP